MCALCGTPLPDRKIYRADECPNCGKALRSCRNCQFYAPGKQYDCSEHITEPVRDKEAANYCDYFSPNRNISSSGRAARDDDALDKFNKLFG